MLIKDKSVYPHFATAEEVRMNIGYRCFSGYLQNEETPHFSTVGYNFKRRYTPETYRASVCRRQRKYAIHKWKEP